MKLVVKVFVGVIAVLAVGMGLIFAIGSALPREHQATHTVELPVPPEVVWSLVADPVGSSAWRPEATVRVVEERDGAPVFEETTRHGSFRYTIEAQEPPRRLVTRVVDNKDFGGRWVYTLEPTSTGGTHLAITEDGEIYNAMFRFFARFVFGYDSTLQHYAGQLAAHCATLAPQGSG